MEGFARFIRNAEFGEGGEPAFVPKKIKVAIIDDGVLGFSKEICERISDGVSYCKNPGREDYSKHYYFASGGHGTDMAHLICKVCPSASLYIARLDEGLALDGKRQISGDSVVKVRHHPARPR